MVPTDSIALRLRFREHDHSHEPPDVGAFRRSSAPSGAEPSPRLPEEIGVVEGSGRLQPRAPLVVFFQHAGYGIPAIARGRGERLPDVTSWSLRPTVFGYLATVTPPPSASHRSRAAWVVAACLPLVLPLPAAAAPAREPPPIQSPQREPAVPLPPGAEAEPSAEPNAEASAETEAAPADDATLEPPMPDPALRSGTSELDPATVDAAWEGVDGFDVVLELKGGGRMSGRVGAVQRDTFTLIQADTGTVLVLPKSGVVSLRVRLPAPLPKRTGTGALIGGGILTGVGTPVFVTGLAFLGICPSCASLHLPMLLIGGAALGGGIPLLVRGVRARKVYREALQERALTPMVARTPHGWTGGLRFRF